MDETRLRKISTEISDRIYQRRFSTLEDPKTLLLFMKQHAEVTNNLARLDYELLIDYWQSLLIEFPSPIDYYIDHFVEKSVSNNAEFNEFRNLVNEILEIVYQRRMEKTALQKRASLLKQRDDLVAKYSQLNQDLFWAYFDCILIDLVSVLNRYVKKMHQKILVG